MFSIQHACSGLLDSEIHHRRENTFSVVAADIPLITFEDSSAEKFSEWVYHLLECLLKVH